MDTKIEFYNTPIVEGRKILAYKGFVCANQVAGTGFMTDFIASFSDLFGGHSGVYRDAMNDLQENVFRQLEEQARQKGANAVIGIHLDFDNISAKGMSMFMVSVQGTAVILEQQPNACRENSIVSIDGRIMKQKVFVQNILARQLSVNSLSQEEWKTIINYADISIADTLHEIYCSILSNNGEPYERFKNNYKQYFARLPYEKEVELVYNSDKELYTICEFDLFDAKRILSWAQNGNINFAINCLRAEKASYNLQDIKDMEDLYKFLTSLPDVGHLEEVQKGVFSSGGLKFVCQCGKKNEKDVEFCDSCGKNIKGLIKEQVQLINRLGMKISILKELLANQ